MCPPDYFGIEYEINPWMNVGVGSDTERVAPAVVCAPRHPGGAGCRRRADRAGAGLPDLVFTANAGWCIENLFISSRFRFGVRQGETPPFRGVGASDADSRSSSMPEGLHFEGAGDALFCGETLFAGYRFRSDVRSHQWVGERLGVEVLPMELVDPAVLSPRHLLLPAGAGSALYYPGAFDEYGRSVLRDRIPNLIEVAAEEAISFSCNAVVVGRDGDPQRGGAQAGRRARGSRASRCGRSASPSSSSRAAAPSA